MMTVKEPKRLLEYGFEQKSEVDDLYVKLLEPREGKQDGVCVELVVNPLSENCIKNEIMLYIYADTSDFHGRTEVDMLIDCDEIMRLVAEGVVEYVPNGERKVCCG